MMLKSARYSEMADRIMKLRKRIIIYGAGMIGQIVVPYMIEYYGLTEYVDYYVDTDSRKQKQKICIGSEQFDVMPPDILKEVMGNPVLLITNSKFYPIVEFLDSITSLEYAEVYIIPMMQIFEMRFAKKPEIVKLTDTPVIPRKIHYCWFSGKPMPQFLQNCMESWKKQCPDYEIICWNEDSYDIKKISYIKEAYEHCRYGFVTDVARLDILYQYGGIYMDTDVTLLKRLDDLLYQSAFVGVEKWGNINTGGCVGAIPGHPMIRELLDFRTKIHFVREDGSFNTETNGLYETIPFLRHGMHVDNTMQIINGVTVYPSSVFHPYDYMSGEDNTEDWTFSRHHFYGGWMKKEDFEERGITQKKYQQILKRMEA